MSDSAIVVVVMLAVVAGLATAVLVREDSAPGVPLISSTGEVEITSEQMATISELANEEQRNRRFCLTAPKEIGGWAIVPHHDGTETFCERRLTP